MQTLAVAGAAFFWAVFTSGVTIVVTTSRLAGPLRRLAPKFLGCPMCVGFWVGIASSATMRIGLAGMAAPWTPLVAQWVADGFCASCACWVLHVALVRMGSERL
jgi:hypothetical protein